MIQNFFYVPERAPTFIEGVYDPMLVALSLLMAMLGAGVAYQLAHAARESRNHGSRVIAKLSGAMVLGLGIWGMHFIGLLALDICSSAKYEPISTLISFVPGVLGAWALMSFLMSRDSGKVRMARGMTAIALASSIGLMHFVGMEALKATFEIRYVVVPFSITLMVAVALCYAAIKTNQMFESSPRIPRWLRNIGSGLVLGCAICSIHYIAMWATRFLSQHDLVIPGEIENHTVWLVSAAVFATGLVSLMGNAILRHRDSSALATKREQALRTIVESTGDVVLMVNDGGIIQSVNAAGPTLFQYTEAVLVGLSVRELLSDSYRISFDAALQESSLDELASRMRKGVEIKLRKADGSKFPARITLGRSKSDGEITYVVFIADISERLRHQSELKQREQQLSSLMSSLPGATYRYLNNKQRSPVFISQGIEKITGWSADAFMSGDVDFLETIHSDDRLRLPKEINAALLHGKTYSLTYRIRTRSGDERWVNENSTVSTNESGELAFIDGVLLDVTEAKQKSAELEGLVQAMQRVLSIIEFDMTGKVLRVNDRFTALTGYAAETVVNQPHMNFFSATDEGRKSYEDLWNNLQRGEFLEKEYYRKHRDGSDLYVYSYYNPILGPDGKPFKVMSFSTDLTERYAMERDLRHAKENAEAAVKAKSAFLANMSHELRTPMNSILGFTEMLLDEPMSADHKKHLRTVHDSGESLLRLLNDVLDSAKLDYGAVELELAPFSLKDMCRHSLAMVAVSAEEKGLDLHFDYPSEVAECFMGDKFRIQQVALNIMNNAVKFTARGNVSLSVRQHGELVHIVITDTGIGIAPDRLNKIFEPFVQADVSTTRRYGGTGLGTTIARQLVELMGGRIHVSSELGSGSEFRIELPLKQSRMQGEVVPLSGADLPAMHFLLVDDVPQNLDLLSLMLSRSDHTFEIANNGLEAVERFQLGRFDVVLMDMQMPVMDGMQATTAIRLWEQAQGRNRTPILALTANVMSADREAALACGMDGFSTKPVQRKLLYAEIQRVLNGQVLSDDISLKSGAAGEERAAPTPPESQTADIDWEYGIDLWGGRDVLCASIHKFLASHGPEVEAMDAAAPPDAALLSAQMHRIRGAAANLGLQRIALAAGELEHLSPLDVQRYATLVLELQRCIADVQSELAV